MTARIVRGQWLAVAAAGVLALSACTTPPTAGGSHSSWNARTDPPMTNAQLDSSTINNETLAKVTGTAMVRGSVKLPADTRFEAVLIDPSRPELFCQHLAAPRHQDDIVDSADGPIAAFMIPYDTSTIDPTSSTSCATFSSGSRYPRGERNTKVLPRATGTALDNAIVMQPEPAPR